MTTLVGLRTAGAMKATILTSVVVAISGAGLCYREGHAQTEQEEESEAAYHVARWLCSDDWTVNTGQH